MDAWGLVRDDGVAPHAVGCVRRADAALEYASEAALAYIRRGLRERSRCVVWDMVIGCLDLLRGDSLRIERLMIVVCLS